MEIIRQGYYSQESPMITFYKGRMNLNALALSLYPETDYIQLLVDKEKKILIVKILTAKTKDALQWCTAKHKPRKVKCVPVCALLGQLLGWNMNNRYRISGVCKTANYQDMIVFNLEEATCYMFTDDPPKDMELKTYEDSFTYEMTLAVNEKNKEKMKEMSTDESVSTQGNI